MRQEEMNMNRRTTILQVWMAAWSVLAAATAAAEPGVFEINRTCAIETGCFVGDSPGYPVTITRAGSYRLTGNLSVQSGTGSQSNSMIAITATDVDLDLGGFRVSCSALQVGSV
jgi:hypothetical protein